MNPIDIAFVEAEMLSVAPFPADKCGQFKLQIFSKHGRTKWLNITAEQFNEIEKVLLGIKPGTKIFPKKLEN